MTCILHVYGTRFQAARFLAGTSIPPSKLLCRGKEPFFNGTYIIIRVSEEETFSSQIEDALTFLQTYQDDLKRLRDYSDVEEVCLNFSIRLEGTISQHLNFPNQLHQLARQNGIDLNIFSQEAGCSSSRNF